MNWATFIYLSGLMLLGTFCWLILIAGRSYCKQKEAGAFSGGQAFVHQEHAKASERMAKANAYLAQVQSMETAWQSYLDNHYAIAGNKPPSGDDIRTMRAAFENMYDFSYLETPQ